MCLPNTGQNSHFQHFFAKKLKKLKKSNKFAAKFCKYSFFDFAPKHLSSVKFSKNSFFLMTFFCKSCESLLIWFIFWVDCQFISKNLFFEEFSCKFFLKLFVIKNAENDYFDQRLAFAAPKRWSKYTTHKCTGNAVNSEIQLLAPLKDAL